MARVEDRPNDNYWHFLDVTDTGAVSGTQRKVHYRYLIDVRVSGSSGSWGGPRLFRANVDGVNHDLNATFDTRPGTDLIPVEGDQWITVGATGKRIGFYLEFSGWSSSFPAAKSPTGFLTLAGTATVPAPPTPVGLDQITPTSMRYRFVGNSSGGSPVTGYQFQYSTSSAFTGATWLSSNGTSTVTGLAPNTTYYFRSRGLNAIGAGSPSSTISAKTIAPARVKVSGTWKYAIPYVKVAGTWRQAKPYVKVGGVWKPAA